MPTYGFKCPKCGFALSERRLFAGMDDPAPACPGKDCTAQLERVFTPNPNIHVSLAFKSGYSWSDFHDKSERELARDPNVIRQSEALSKPGPAAAIDERQLAAAYGEAKAELTARGDTNG